MSDPLGTAGALTAPADEALPINDPDEGPPVRCNPHCRAACERFAGVDESGGEI